MMLRLLHAPKTGGTALAWALRGTGVRRCGHSKTLADMASYDCVLTVVRDPVARFCSIWGWLMKTYPARAMTPEALLERDMLDIGQGLDIMAPQSHWLGPAERLLELAFWIGHTETLDADFARLRRLMGLGPGYVLPPHGHKNRNEGPPAVQLHPQTIDRIRERYAIDYQLLEEISTHA